MAGRSRGAGVFVGSADEDLKKGILSPPVALFLQISRARMPIRWTFLLLAISLLAACRDKEASRHFAGAPPAEPSREEQEAVAAAPGALTSTGQIAFNGASSFFCVPSAGGLQVDFRTGSQEMPTVAVRIEGYRGSGPYAARLFVTGRSDSGGLVTSTGEAHVEVKQQDPAAAGAAGVVSGTFQGRYEGAAGQGSIEGRFASCNYSPSRGGSSPPVANAISATGTGGQEEQPAGATEETHERPSDTSRLPARTRAGGSGTREGPAATGRRGRRARSAHGGRRARGRRGRGAGVRGPG